MRPRRVRSLLIRGFGVGLLLLVPLTGWGRVAQAADGPTRQVEVIRTGPRYEWWVARWEDRQVLCAVTVYHEGLPTVEEVGQQCGSEVAAQWLETPACAAGERCQGVYLMLHRNDWGEYTVTQTVPPPQVWVQPAPQADCRPADVGLLCNAPPVLQLVAEDPHPDGQVIRVEGRLGSTSFACAAATCEVTLQPTGEQAVTMLFWALSSLGDRSPAYRLTLRVSHRTVQQQEVWRLDVAGERWQGPQAACAAEWEALPVPDTPLPTWLTAMTAPATDRPYVLLAGQLIAAGLVDASACPQGGLEAGGGANACGLAQARDLVTAWQNRFNADIDRAAAEVGVPAGLLKRLFAQESQFWPEAAAGGREFGLGHLTAEGADVLLLWSPETYAELCAEQWNPALCRQGYATRPPEEQAQLRGALLQAVRVPVCANCDPPLEEAAVRRSITLFARALQANCRQVGQMVRNVSRRAPGAVSTLPDLWRMTLANYNVGAGCLYRAMQSAWTAQKRLDWESVAAALPPECAAAADYVAQLTR